MASSTASRLTQVPLIIVLVLVLGYAGIKGYVYLQVSGQIDRVNDRIVRFAELRHGHISSGLDGSVSVADLRLVPRGSGKTIGIEEVRLQGDGPLFLLTGLQGLKKGDPPGELDLWVRGLRLPLEEGLTAQYFGASGGKLSAGDECAFTNWLSPESLRSAGIDELTADFRVSYRHREKEARLKVRMEMELRRIQSMSVEVELKNVSEPGTVVMGVPPQVEELSLRYEMDPEFVAGTLARCAQQRGVSRGELIDAMFRSGEEGLVSGGIVPGPGLRRALEGFLRNPGAIVVRLRPSPGVSYASLGAYKPEDALALLNPTVEINGRPVRDLSFDLAAPSGASSTGALLAGLPGLGQSGTAGDDSQEGEPGDDNGSRPRIRLEYVPTPVRELSDYVGRNVRIHTRNEDRLRQGRLAGFQGEDLVVERRVHGGTIQVYVPLTQVARAEVRRPVEQTPPAE